MTDEAPPSRPPQDAQQIGSPEQFAALAHPLRQRLLFALGRRPATISGLASQLGVAKGSVSHHLKVLRAAGLVYVAETRQVRGGTEQRYQRTARRMVVADPEAAGTAAMFGAFAQELDRSPEGSAVRLRHLHLGPDKARRLRELLVELVDEAEEDEDDQPVLGVLVALYRPAGPAGGG
ncbi:winged helix-turn-helix domain-containing protein [Streptomyces sp. V4-01]|uniref:Winged helix-turn-helix domain-containing protein n=1 Tax=Actinacidiphila polyblastidii TaxID=3110430 RepID=A0ABU7PIC2_9ACTN|nr:winged helix-turn-helix domain-containing protein [Streptomyces sp. V4-01]